MSPSRPALGALLALLAAAGPAAAAGGDPVMALSEVRRGMECTGYTVIRATDISSFAVRVEDVVYDAVGSADILVTISGPAVDETGAGPGFSGSPIYCPSPSDGTPRVAGALAYGIGDYDNKTLLATPIEAMLGDPVSPPASARRATAAERRAAPLGSALSLSGLSPRVGGAFSAAAARAGIALRAAPAAGRAATAFPVQALRPGSAVSAGYSSGDVALGATGTVSYVDGTSVWAFGHPLDSVGRRSLFLQDAYVYGVISSPAIGGQGTYKLAAPGHDVGTLTGDGVNSITGVTGALPPSFPLILNARDRDTGAERTYRVELADERLVGNPTGLSPLGLVGTSVVAQAAYDTLRGSPVNSSGDMCVSFRVAQRSRALGFCNTYVAQGTGLAAEGAGALAGTAPISDFGAAAALIDSYRLGPLTLRAVNVTLRLRRGLAQAFMTRLEGPRRLRRGTTATVRLRYRRAGGVAGSIRVRVPVPATTPRGPRELVLTGTPSDLAGGGLDPVLASLVGDGEAGDEGGPRSLGALAKQIARLHRYDGITARFRAGRGGGSGRALRVHRDPRLRYSGTVRLRVVVR